VEKVCAAGRADGGGTVFVIGEVDRGDCLEGEDVRLSRGLVAVDDWGLDRIAWCGGDGTLPRGYRASNDGLRTGRLPNLSTAGGDAYPGRDLEQISTPPPPASKTLTHRSAPDRPHYNSSPSLFPPIPPPAPQTVPDPASAPAQTAY
jgi:hypothetical protein